MDEDENEEEDDLRIRVLTSTAARHQILGLSCYREIVKLPCAVRTAGLLVHAERQDYESSARAADPHCR